MSLAKLVFPQLAWAELEHLLLFLEWRDQWLLASTNRSAFIAFLRCRSIRECQKYKTSPPTTRFLSKLSGHDRVLLVSYPRCGNSFFRKLIEEHTNIVTGSDSRPNRTLSASLLRFGYRGEGITDSSVWLVKSHFPERLGYIRLNVKRVILLVRNPFDALESYFHMGFTNTHNKRLTEQEFKKLAPLWDEFITNEAKIYQEFHDYWMKLAEQIPILCVRYEDILQDQKNAVQKTLEFMEDGASPSGLSRYYKGAKQSSNSSANNLINSTCNGPVTDSGAGYQPKKVKIGKALAVMTDEQIQRLQTLTKTSLQIFGYKIKNDSIVTVSLFPEIKTSHRIDQEVNLVSINENYAEFDSTDISFAKHLQISSTKVLNDAFITINDTRSIRDENDKFGRKFTDLRKSLTDNDRLPLETI